MDLQHIREFVTLERICNYTRAADALYTTEATLSRHIRALEKELGQPAVLTFENERPTDQKHPARPYAVLAGCFFG